VTSHLPWVGIFVALGKFLETLVFEVAGYRNVADDCIWRMNVRWLFDQHERIQRAKWSDWTSDVMATELGVVRGLTLAFSDPKRGRGLSPLPSWDDAQKVQKQNADEGFVGRKPAWIKKYEQANRDRLQYLHICDGGEQVNSGA